MRQETVQEQAMHPNDRRAVIAIRTIHALFVAYLAIASLLAFLGFRLRANLPGIISILMLAGTVIVNIANGNRCPLTQLEQRILRKYQSNIEYTHFSASWAERFGIKLPRRFWDVAFYVGYGGGALLGLIR